MTDLDAAFAPARRRALWELPLRLLGYLLLVLAVMLGAWLDDARLALSLFGAGAGCLVAAGVLWARAIRTAEQALDELAR